MLTGLRPDSAKVWTLDVKFRDTIPDAVTLPQHFKANGYETLSYGKIFHNPWPDNVSWSQPHSWPKRSKLWSESAKQKFRDFKEDLRKAGKPERLINRLRPQAVEIVDIPDKEHIDGAIAVQAIDALRNFAGTDKPFFLAAGFIRPHLPFVVPRKYWDLYERDKIPLVCSPQLPEGAPPFAMNTMYELRDYYDYLGTPRPPQGSLTLAQQRDLKHGYYASVSFVDAQVGKILGALDDLGFKDNTIVTLWSDHGFKLGEHNSWCKQTNYEIDTRVPLILRDPKAKGNGKSSDALVELLDVYPTLCELTGLPIPESLEGKSLRPVLEDPSSKVKDAAISQFQRRIGKQHLMGYALRTDQFRYIEWLDRKTKETVAKELYDHDRDPGETQNVAGQTTHSATITKLANQLRKTLPLPLAPEDPRFIQKRPNIVVIMGDDWSWPHASILGDPVVKTPNFDRIAREGILYENAFACTPSCTPSRFSIATGQYPWRLGEAANLGGSLAKDVPVYGDILAKAGYHVGFSRKGTSPSQHKYRKSDPFGKRFKDFSLFLQKRKPGQSFCYWYGAGEPHRPYDWKASLDSDLDLEKIQVPPYLPDNDITHTDLGDYYLKVDKLDRLAGQILRHLEKAGELDNTLIVMAGDHGMPFPRAKATLYDSGTRVPLAIRWPEKIQPDQRTEHLTSLHQLAPLFLRAAGLPLPQSMQNTPAAFPFSKGTKDSFLLLGMERHVYPNPCRAIRTKDFLLIRNSNPQSWPTGRQPGKSPTYDFSKTPWPTEPGAFSHNIDPSPTKQWMLHNGHPANEQAFGVRPEVELYDLQKDPHQLQNVAQDKAYSPILQNLSAMLEKGISHK